ARLAVLVLCANFVSQLTGASEAAVAALPVLGSVDRTSLIQAASKPSVLPWQRDVMMGVAGASNAGFVPPRPDSLPAMPNAAASNNGTWVQLPLAPPSEGSGPYRVSSAAIYDPIRHRMLVFGGADQNYQND